MMEDTIPLRRNSPIPLYYQLAEWIREQIQVGELAVGARLPSEREFSDQFKISRMTVRQAIGYLVQQGILEAQKGIGTFVAEPKLAHNLLHLLSFTQEMMRDGGTQPRSRVLEQSIGRPPHSVARNLNLAPGENAVKIARLRLSGEMPLVLETAYIPAALCPGLLHKDLATISLYAILEQDYGFRPVRAAQTLEATTANEYESQLLMVEPGMAMILVEGVTYLDQDRPVECFKAIYRGDRFKFRLDSRRDAAAEAADQPRISMVLA